MNTQKQDLPTGFQIPERPVGMSAAAYDAFRLASLSSRLAAEERTLVNHPNGRAENVAEHSQMLALVAPAIAEQLYPELNANLICRFASIHDAVEAYAGDTPTHDISSADLEQKAGREAAGLQRLRQDFRNMPGFVAVIDDYEAQRLAEARFVRVLDKWMPALVNMLDHGVTLRAQPDQTRLLAGFARQTDRLRSGYPEFSELIAVREELFEWAVKQYSAGRPAP